MESVGVVGRNAMPSKSLSAKAAIESPAAAAVAWREDPSPLLAICNATVALYKQAFGRGPTKVRAHYASPDTIVVLLEQTLTAAERNLVALGHQDRLRESRLIVQRALEDRLRDTVEGTLGRRAIAVMSAIDVDRDVCAEILTLEPRGRERRVGEPVGDASRETVDMFRPRPSKCGMTLTSEPTAPQ